MPTQKSHILIFTQFSRLVKRHICTTCCLFFLKKCPVGNNTVRIRGSCNDTAMLFRTIWRKQHKFSFSGSLQFSSSRENQSHVEALHCILFMPKMNFFIYVHLVNFVVSGNRTRSVGYTIIAWMSLWSPWNVFLCSVSVVRSLKDCMMNILNMIVKFCGCTT